MTTWIIAYSKDGNTSTLKTEAERKLEMEDAVGLVMRKAEQDYADEAHEVSEDEDMTPAQQLAERYGITITGISEA
ncbi:hypothetical protein [Stutzerimonas urumqiensis]|uniref:hypothetical protein n=1 Tax=Stutzerimonas urumqiensis TaxID=638269 RepID=UPI000EAF2764|nr:hypothetical protein [Stutzerimonas urumqiensis]